jgi:hypothetical protein
MKMRLVSQPSLRCSHFKFYNIAVDTLLNIEMEKLSELQLRQLEQGEDVFIKGGRLRVLATNINSDIMTILSWLTKKPSWLCYRICRS